MPLFLAGEGALALPTPPPGVTVLPRDLRVAAAIGRRHRPLDVDAARATATSPPSADPAYGGAMRITHLGHACLLVEMADTRLLVDPGAFTDDLSDVRDLSAVLVTHQHADHLDPERLPALVAANPDAVVLCDPEQRRRARRARGRRARPRRLGHHGRRRHGDTVRAQHALIHDDIPRITNVGVRLDAEGEPSFFHPGDALDAEPGDVDVLAFPLQAPWQRSRDMTAFLRRLAAPHAVPVHDGLLQARGRGLYLNQAGQLGSQSTRIHDLAGAGPTEFRADR